MSQRPDKLGYNPESLPQGRALRQLLGAFIKRGGGNVRFPAMLAQVQRFGG